MKKYGVWIWGIAALILVIGGFVWYQSQPGKLDQFASCLKDKGAIFYGAFWCPHCQSQKAMFGRSQRLLPYVECSTPDGRSQIQLCNDKGIQSYPTWIFADGSTFPGVAELTDLAEKTSCSLPT